jgi:uncharacterized protein involved in exopolysaccharide biosynthesis
MPDDDLCLIRVSELTSALWGARRWLFSAPVAAAVVAYGLADLLPPRYTATASFMPQQQGNSPVSSALASLGPLVGLGGGAPKNSPEQIVALLQSRTVSDRLIDKFDLVKVYKSGYRIDARNQLMGNLRFSVGKRDGLIYIEADDRDPKRAAELANSAVAELQTLLSTLAVTEAQQRRLFFEGKLKEAQENLTQAQVALQGAEVSSSTLRTEPRVAAEEYVRLKAEVVNAEVRVQTLRGFLHNDAPEVRQALATLAALRQQLARSSRSGEARSGRGDQADYVSKYRNYKYQETLFELFARQYEAARVDESRDGALVQVVDVAKPPEKRSGPRKARIAAASGIGVMLLVAVLVIGRVVRQRLQGG